MDYLNNSKKSKEIKLRRQCQKLILKRNNVEAFWSKFDDEMPECCCEKVSVSPYSPYPITSDEKLASVITSERYVSGTTGKARKTIADRLHNGISADRVIHTDLSSFELRAYSLVESHQAKRYIGVIVFSSSALRRINHDQNRFFAVYDTAIKENIAHAEIVMTNYPKDPNLTKKQRNKGKKFVLIIVPRLQKP